ncbi:MAG: hypothetical protein R2827_15765 [Bdellovibrionales bacterium]
MSNKQPKINIRNADYDDIPGIVELSKKVYKKMGSYKPEMVRGQISHFPDGCFVVEINNVIVAYSASLLIDEKQALEPHLENHYWKWFWYHPCQWRELFVWLRNLC